MHDLQVRKPTRLDEMHVLPSSNAWSSGVLCWVCWGRRAVEETGGGVAEHLIALVLPERSFSRRSDLSYDPSLLNNARLAQGSA